MDTNKPEEKVLLENILKSLPCDQDWDEGVPREKSLKQAGEKRYLYQSTLLTERKLSTYDSNRLTAGVDSGDKKVLQQMNDKEPASASCTVKVEYPLSASLKEKLNVLRSAKVKLEKHASTLQDLVAEGEAAKNDGVVKTGESSLSSLTPFLVTLRTATAKLDKLASDTVTKEHVAEAEALAVQAEAHFDGSKRVMAKCKAILS